MRQYITRSVILATLLATGLALPACQSDSAEGQSQPVVDDHDWLPYASYERSDMIRRSSEVQIVRLSLQQDHQYRRLVVVDDVTEEQSGFFSFSITSEGKKYIRFYDEKGAYRDRFRFVPRDDGYAFQRFYDSPWFTMRLAEAGWGAGTGGGDGAGGSVGAGGSGGSDGGGGSGGARPWVLDCPMHPLPFEVVGGGRYATVADAVLAAPAGAEVRICPGTHQAATVEVERDLTIRGAGEARSILEAGSGESAVLRAVDVDLTVEDVTLRRTRRGVDFIAPTSHALTIRRSTLTQHSWSALEVSGGQTSLDRATLTLDQVTILNNTGYDGGGMNLEYWVDATLTDCLLQGNVAAQHGGGIFIGVGSHVVMSNTIVHQNTALLGGGAYLEAGYHYPVSDLTVTTSDWAVGQALENAPDDVFCSTLYSPTQGDAVGWLGANANVTCTESISGCCQ